MSTNAVLHKVQWMSVSDLHLLREKLYTAPKYLKSTWTPLIFIGPACHETVNLSALAPASPSPPPQLLQLGIIFYCLLFYHSLNAKTHLHLFSLCQPHTAAKAETSDFKSLYSTMNACSGIWSVKQTLISKYWSINTSLSLSFLIYIIILFPSIGVAIHCSAIHALLFFLLGKL